MQTKLDLEQLLELKSTQSFVKQTYLLVEASRETCNQELVQLQKKITKASNSQEEVKLVKEARLIRKQYCRFLSKARQAIDSAYRQASPLDHP